MKYLIVVAHPDDEVLGAGASIYKWTKKGDVVERRRRRVRSVRRTRNWMMIRMRH